LHGDNTGAFDCFALVQIDKSQIGSAAVDINRGRESLIERRAIGSAAVEKARLDRVQALGDTGEIGHDLVVTGRNTGHLFVTTIDDVFAGDIGRRGVEIAPLPPFEQDIVDGLPALERLAIEDVDRGAVAGEARDGAGLGSSIAPARDDPRHRGDLG
ncbi:MAG: hypothetical protein ACK56I_19180, partial [bacterium]